MRLVIPYRLSGDGVELLYAIRSIYKYFAPLSGVLLIGDKPEWYNGDHIPLADLKGEKEKSMMLKVLQAQDEDFLYSNDDYFALQPFNENLPNYYDTTCQDMAGRHPIPSYRDLYMNCPGNWLNFDIHTPMIMNRDRFKAAFDAMDGQTPIKTTYGNYKPRVGNTEYLCDLKINGAHMVYEIEQLVSERPFFSTHDSAIEANMLAVFSYLYPDTSPVEK